MVFKQSFKQVWYVTAAIFVALLCGMIHWHIRHLSNFTIATIPSTPDAALSAFRNGNNRFVQSSRILSIDTGHDAEERHRTSKGQHPFAAVLCCADSRVCPEFIFDQRPGSIFEIRNAGNVVDEDVLASFEYAVDHLQIPLIVVLGHKGCGAVEAVYNARDGQLPDHLQALQKHMSGIHQQIINNSLSSDSKPPELMDHLAIENGKQQARILLKDSEILRTAAKQGIVRILSGIYDMESGSVEFFDLK